MWHRGRHIRHAIVQHAVDKVDRLRVRRGGDVSKQPPWSMATSTTTAPRFMLAIISRFTSRGADAPGISTAPTTRSAVFRFSLMVHTLRRA